MENRTICPRGGDTSWGNVHCNRVKRLTVIGWLVSLAMLISFLIGLHCYVASMEINIEAPEILSVCYEDDNIILTWSTVDFATSYRVYSRSVDGNWNQIKVVSGSTVSYSEEFPENAVQYAVRACNVCGDRISLSEYSVPTGKIGE